MISNGTKKLHPLLKVSIATFGFLVFCTLSLNSQTQRIDHIQAQNFEATGQVIELTTPNNWKLQPIIIGWQTQSGQEYSEQVLISNGKNIITPNEGWNGTIRVLATNVQGLQTRIVPYNLNSKLIAFLTLRPMSRGRINFDEGYTFGNTKLSTILFCLLFVTGIIFIFLLRKSVTVAIAMGLIVAFYCLNLRQIKNQVDVIQNFKINQQQIPPFEGLEHFLDSCQATVGPASWTIEKLPGVWNSYAKYSMATNEYIPNSNPENSNAAFLITNNDSRNSNVVNQVRGIKLIKINQ